MKKLLATITIFILLANFSYGINNGVKPSSYNELVSWYKELEREYPNYIEVFKANEMYHTGKAGKYDLYYVCITNESNGFHKPEVLSLGSPHGDETVGTIGLYYFTKWMMNNKDKEWIKWILNNREIYIEISHNPYGFDHKQRWDENGWDLNREADYDWKGEQSELWGSMNGKTLWQFINHHAIRVGCDFHGGTRMILYPWSSTHRNVVAKSPFSGKEYKYVPPDFYFYHVATLRLGEYMGSYGGKLDEENIGPVASTINYEAPGCLAAWAYGANVLECPAEDEFVDDEENGNYDGCGILWISPEMSFVKDPPEWKFGNENSGYISEVIKLVMHQTDLAQPYIRWVHENNSFLKDGKLRWQVYGCLVVDETYVLYSFNGDFKNGIKGKIHDDYKGMYRGGTYWDGKVWEEEIEIPENATDVYAIAFAKVDGIYKNVVAPYEYGNKSYLRIIKERCDPDYEEVLNTSDGMEIIKGHIWWQSSVIHLKIGGITQPEEGYLYIAGRKIAKIGETIIIGKMNVSVAGKFNRVEFYLDNELKYTDYSYPYTWEISPSIGKHVIKVKMYYEDRNLQDGINAFLFII